MTQLSLGLALTLDPPTKAAERPSIAERFATFHSENPHVFDALRQLALDYARQGHRRISMKWLWEQLRIKLQVGKTGPWKLDNSYTALMSRMLVASEPSLAPLIELRERTSK